MYFWISEDFERECFQEFADSYEANSVDAMLIPRMNTCEVTIAGETVVMQYHGCADQFMEYPFGASVTDHVCLGEGQAIHSRALTWGEIVIRMHQLGMVIPSSFRKINRGEQLGGDDATGITI